MRSQRFTIVVCIAITGAAIFCGCSDAPRLARVNGVLTYKNKPVQNVQVNFYPESGARPSWGLTDASGKFTLEYDKDNKGALIGKHKVSVRPGPGQKNLDGDEITTGELAEFYRKYGNDSTVVVEIEASTRDIKLAWD